MNFLTFFGIVNGPRVDVASADEVKKSAAASAGVRCRVRAPAAAF
jgi:hypothetical protein